MTDIDDLLNGASDKARVVERAKESTRAVIFSLPGDDESGEWVLSYHGMTRGDLAHAICTMQAEYARHYLEANDD